MFQTVYFSSEYIILILAFRLFYFMYDVYNGKRNMQTNRRIDRHIEKKISRYIFYLFSYILMC